MSTFSLRRVLQAPLYPTLRTNKSFQSWPPEIVSIADVFYSTSLFLFWMTYLDNFSMLMIYESLF